jgi:hypothetical protein
MNQASKANPVPGKQHMQHSVSLRITCQAPVPSCYMAQQHTQPPQPRTWNFPQHTYAAYAHVCISPTKPLLLYVHR